MTKDEALRMAVEALEMHVPHYVKDRGCEALNACKEALEQPKEKKYLYAYSYDGLIVWAESNQNIADRFVFIGKIEVQDD